MPTLDQLLVKHGAAFPVIRRGSNGQPWIFDSEMVLQFLEQNRAAAAKSAAERSATLDQLSLPIGHNGGPPLGDDEAPRPLRPAELLMLAKLRKMEREEAYACGRLVEVAPLRECLREVLRIQSRTLRDMATRFGVEHDLSEADQAGLLAAVLDWQREFVAEVQAAMRSSGDRDATPLQREPELEDFDGGVKLQFGIAR